MVTIYSLDVKQIIINTLKIDWAGLAYMYTIFLFLRWSWFGIMTDLLFNCFFFFYSTEFSIDWLFSLKSYCKYYFFFKYFVIKIEYFWKSCKIYETNEFQSSLKRKNWVYSFRNISLRLSIDSLLCTTQE